MARSVINRGISLVEVLISLLIFSICMLGAGLMVLKSFSLARDGLYQTKAADLLQMQYEIILARGLVEKHAWQQRVALTLPQGEGLITQDQGMVRIQIAWQASDFSVTHSKRSICIAFPTV